MRRRIPLLIVLAALLATLLPAAPARAAVTGCNSNFSLGVNIDSATPSGSSTQRNLWAKVCIVYDHDSTRATLVTACRLNDAVTPCDHRSSGRVKLDHYQRFPPHAYVQTLTNNTVGSSGSGYQATWSYSGTDRVWTTQIDDYLKNNTFDIYWRLGADQVLRYAGHALGPMVLVQE
jgi:hypothetical protein